MPLRIFVAENNEVIRSVICALIVAHPGWDICGEAADGIEAVQKIAELKPDIVLLDFDMPGKNGLEVTREGWISYKIIFLIATESEAVIRAAFDAGARGFMIRTRATQDLNFAIEAIKNGRTYFTPRFAESILQGRLETDTTPGAMTEWQREHVCRLALELATPYRHHRQGINLRHPLRKYAIVALLVAASAAAGWVTYRGAWDRLLPEVRELSVEAGINPPAPQAVNRGNPDRKVWIDVHTAQYFCPGSNLYGRTRRGRLSTQADAQRDHFEPAGMKVCD